jgi:hypothetical protein
MIIDTSAEPEQKPIRTRNFRPAAPLVRFSPDQIKRQNDLIRAAWQSLKSKDAVMAFLNAHNDQLEGVPLRLALASEQGLKSAQELLLRDAR